MSQMRSLAAAAYPNEGCGILIGSIADSRTTIVDATSAGNLNVDRARDRYDLDPADFLRADRDARERGLDVVGIWHSHPDHPARPSQTDTDRAWLDYVYIICSTSSAGTRDVNAFTLSGEGGPFVAIPLDADEPASPHRK
jgi:proteasome lid subunit RPN8/RPN11